MVLDVGYYIYFVQKCIKFLENVLVYDVSNEDGKDVEVDVRCVWIQFGDVGFVGKYRYGMWGVKWCI